MKFNWKGSLLGAVSILLGAALKGSDCNQNGLEDFLEIASGSKPDCNQNGIPDDCDIHPVNYGLTDRIDFAVGEGPVAMASADFDGDGKVDIVTASTGANVMGFFWNLGGTSFGRGAAVDAGPRGPCRPATWMVTETWTSSSAISWVSPCSPTKGRGAFSFDLPSRRRNQGRHRLPSEISMATRTSMWLPRSSSQSRSS